MTDGGDDSGLSVSVHHPQTEEAEIPVSNQFAPVVFQCSQCNSVVGDSSSWLSSSQVMRTITLSAVTSKVGVRQEVEISTNGFDKDSTYKRVYCVTCNERLGKQYLASSPDLDCIRGCFTLMVEKLNSYEIGSAENGSIHDLADFLSAPDSRQMQQQINKINLLILAMNSRLKALERLPTEDVEDLSSHSSHRPQGTSAPSESNNEEIESVSSSGNLGDMHTLSLSHLKNRQYFNAMGRNTERVSPAVLMGNNHLRGLTPGKDRQTMEKGVIYNDVREERGNRNKSQREKSWNSQDQSVEGSYTQTRRVDGKSGQVLNSPRGSQMGGSRNNRPSRNNPASRMRDVKNLNDGTASVVASSVMEEEDYEDGGPMEQWPSPGPVRNTKKRKIIME